MDLLTGIILAGGKGSRLGGIDKGLIKFQGNLLYQYVLKRLEPQVNNIIISANRNIEIYQKSGYAVITDSIPNYAGPLSGILTTLEIITGNWAVFCACDNPYLPYNYVIKLWNKRNNSAVWVKSLNHNHPTLVLVNKNIINNLKKFIKSGRRKLMDFLINNNGKSIFIKDSEISFTNINTLEELKQAKYKNIN